MNLVRIVNGQRKGIVKFGDIFIVNGTKFVYICDDGNKFITLVADDAEMSTVWLASEIGCEWVKGE